MKVNSKENKILTSDIYKQYIKELKPNPNQWIIIKKWNYRIFKKHEKELYVLIDNYITELIQKEIEEFFKKFTE